MSNRKGRRNIRFVLCRKVELSSLENDFITWFTIQFKWMWIHIADNVSICWKYCSINDKNKKCGWHTQKKVHFWRDVLFLSLYIAALYRICTIALPHKPVRCIVFIQIYSFPVLTLFFFNIKIYIYDWTRYYKIITAWAVNYRYPKKINKKLFFKWRLQLSLMEIRFRCTRSAFFLFIYHFVLMRDVF